MRFDWICSRHGRIVFAKYFQAAPAVTTKWLSKRNGTLSDFMDLVFFPITSCNDCYFIGESKDYVGFHDHHLLGLCTLQRTSCKYNRQDWYPNAFVSSHFYYYTFLTCPWNFKLNILKWIYLKIQGFIKFWLKFRKLSAISYLKKRGSKVASIGGVKRVSGSRFRFFFFGFGFKNFYVAV